MSQVTAAAWAPAPTVRCVAPALSLASSARGVAVVAVVGSLLATVLACTAAHAKHDKRSAGGPHALVRAFR